MHQLNELLKVQIGLAPAMPVSKPSPNGELAKFETALTDQRICNLTDVEPLKQALRYAMVLVGIKAHNVPNDREKSVLLQFIVNNYGGHTPTEIRLAFDLAIAGDLDVEDVKCYENFSPLYFASIMNAYRKWARPKHGEIKPVEKELTNDEKLAIDIEFAAYLQKQVNKWPRKYPLNS
jgi:hypothetical protein